MQEGIAGWQDLAVVYYDEKRARVTEISEKASDISKTFRS